MLDSDVEFRYGIWSSLHKTSKVSMKNVEDKSEPVILVPALVEEEEGEEEELAGPLEPL